MKSEKTLWDAWKDLPDKNELLRMVAVVLVVSSISGGAVSSLRIGLEFAEANEHEAQVGEHL